MFIVQLLNQSLTSEPSIPKVPKVYFDCSRSFINTITAVLIDIGKLLLLVLLLKGGLGWTKDIL